jgi:preprotein translocase subunit SecA
MVPYDVQLIGAIAMHKGMISEMKTGEGKTLVAIFPAYLNALAGRGVHVVTVNDYLAKRDAEWNAPIFDFHGLKVDCIDKYEPNSEARRNAYRADITYGTNNEYGFDYLRDNMVVTPEQLVQRKHHYAIIDEVDSILIDEARTPLIISGPVPEDTQSEKYEVMKPRVEALVQAQQKLVASLVAEAEAALQAGDQEKAGLALFRAQRGFPKNRKLRKMQQEPEIQKLISRTESFYLQENAKNMPVVDEHLYYAVDIKQRTIEMSEKGREFITRKDEDSDFFVIPDMGEETSRIEEELAGIEDEAQRSKERSSRVAELNRRFSEKGDRIHTVNQLLKAYTLFEKDEEYIVQEGKVQIVDEHTGRVLSGRRYSDGLHQAIEAKEQVKVEAATQTYATITLQNYFRMYHKLSGMTGTAATEEGEFNEIYGLDVVVIPTNRPIQRADHEDLVFRTKREKFNAVIEKIREYNAKQQPVLVGTTSVDVSETLSRMLKRAGIDHNVLNAKQNARESEIVAQAGRPGAVTVATNMAGRGTDIKLAEGVKEKGGLAILGTERHESRRIDLQLRGRSGRQGDPGESQFYVSLEDNLMALFGGTERISSLMGRLNFEEGEVIQHPWVTKSLERAQKKVEQNNFSIRKRQLEYDDVLNNQRNVIYSRRRNALLGENLQSDILDMLEELVASVVESYYGDGAYETIHEEILRLLAVDAPVDHEKWARIGSDGLTDLIIDRAIELYRQKEERIAVPLSQALKQIEQADPARRPERMQVIFNDGTRRLRVVADVQKAIETEGHEIVRALERAAVLATIDDKWMEHLRELDSVKEGIGLRAFGQKDPLIEYKREAFEMFRSLMDELQQEVISLIWKAVPEAQADQAGIQQARAQKAKIDMQRARAQHQDSTNMGFSAPQSTMAGTGSPTAQQAAAIAAGAQVSRQQKKPAVAEKEPGRNDQVTIQNVQTGETRNTKWKHAQRMVEEEGWVLIQS